MNILVTGANGQLGCSLADCVAATRSPHNFRFTDVDELDITDAEAVARAIADFRADMIINCAAFTNVEGAEEEQEAAYRINADAPEILAREIERVGGRLIHISTDYVFGGADVNRPCSETQPPNPLGVYGASKLEGERRVAGVCQRYVIIRTAWLYSEYGRNFVKTMADLTSRLPQVTVVIDQAGTPTYAHDLAMAILAVANDENFDSHAGIYHFSNEGVCSWFDLARRVAKRVGTGADVVPCSSDKYPSKVARPSYSVLDKSKIKSTFGIEVPYWTDSLDRCLDNILK